MEVPRAYSVEELKRLRPSPLAVKPPDLPPAEEWMGPPSDNNRPRTANNDRNRGHEPGSIDQNNRRLQTDRHLSRGTTNPEDIILGPPQSNFASSLTPRQRDAPNRPGLGRNEDSRDRFNLRKLGEVENDRPRDGRDGRGGLRSRRGDEQLDKDSEGWSTVKPRKSFGTEGAERFNGRMGGERASERNREERRFKNRDEHDGVERPPRGFDDFTRRKDADQDQDSQLRRNGLGRGRNEPSWFKENNEAPPSAGDRKSNGDRFAEKTRNWREKDERTLERERERGDDRGQDRRWDRDSERNNRHQAHYERDPEWIDESADDKHAHTAEDFQKWKERMKAGSGNTPFESPLKAEGVELSGQSSFFGLDKPKVETPIVLDNVPSGPDKFFETWAQKPKLEAGADPTTAIKQEGVSKAATAGKASRFTSFFAGPKEDKERRQTDPPPQPHAPVIQEADQEKNAHFASLLQKLQMGVQATPTPPVSSMARPPPPAQESTSSTPSQVHDPFSQYRPERNEIPSRSSNRDSQQALQDLLLSRTPVASQPASKPEQAIHDLVNQRQNIPSQGTNRPDSRPSNSNTEFLMNLMQNARVGSEPLRTEQLIMRGPPPQPQNDRQMQQMAGREQEFQRERSSSQQQLRTRRPEVPPGFFEDDLFRRGPPHQPEPRSQGPQQPTQILQRPPPGLDQAPPGWNPQNGQIPPMMGQGRHIAPPPGLQGGRGMPPPGMFPPGFPPMSGFGPPPEAMGGPPRNMGPPPPGFMMPPPGFPGGFPMPGPVPEGMNFGGPYDGRGPPPAGFRRQ